ncbi:hypothetical protein KAFR_0C03800 [Kazachstania africana CBS 2517]|uniref:Uncharacterized protein n=1 Tax=Kazachstania africana (strain ATCC 22294 / BCRC 22015 / CBS 2517 / CECT 1963 / NBRC 1671 / NRRL Y-8276) TaxID=1071382 RepID=H2ASM1_KAZAF|nr:hypothetical protein KAFR_0C03800 [Kazachstania africana CBS 2517]CCF57371.1 hypothetical protein KAFR_0C03800 [Kazachstania africana CBS 2517]
MYKSIQFCRSISSLHFRSCKPKKFSTMKKTKFHKKSSNNFDNKSVADKSSIRGKQVALIGVLAILTTAVSFTYQKNKPIEFIE